MSHASGIHIGDTGPFLTYSGTLLGKSYLVRELLSLVVIWRPVVLKGPNQGCICLWAALNSNVNDVDSHIGPRRKLRPAYLVRTQRTTRSDSSFCNHR